MGTVGRGWGRDRAIGLLEQSLLALEREEGDVAILARQSKKLRAYVARNIAEVALLEELPALRRQAERVLRCEAVVARGYSRLDVFLARFASSRRARFERRHHGTRAMSCARTSSG